MMLAFQLACGQTQIVSDNNQNKSEEVNRVISNSTVNTVEERKKDVDYFAGFKPEHKEVLEEFLKTKPYLRPAVEEVDSILDKSALNDVHKNSQTQFYTAGDFNQDKKEDFAVLLINTQSKKDEERFAVAIFNGDFKKEQKPNYFEDTLQGFSNCFLDFNNMTEKRLYLGVYEGDRYCITYIPRGNGYKYKDCEE